MTGAKVYFHEMRELEKPTNKLH